ncbi:hypothetical protein HW115_09050 [Verrucomicrobiaceae bacterium N1E253]|uniref:Uncharacterized protein n=1 Tax=Oceaniferula marina TaxID=2748318 RepID=A0A851GEA4_9BACT|nr:hypothetical protein [Oceaniferula marina]NWK55756.1 hypothetical protein [Oceaniferula marina]
MKRITNITAALLIATTGFAWFNHHQITVLEAKQEALNEQARSRGIHPEATTGTPFRNHRGNRARHFPTLTHSETVSLGHAFIAYAEEMELLDRNTPVDQATRQRMIDQMDQILALNKKQILTLIQEIQAADYTTPIIRDRLLSFLIRQLGNNHPPDALKVLTESPGILEQVKRHNSLIGGSIRAWASENPGQALAWFDQHIQALPANAADQFEYDLICGTASSDIKQAFSLFNRFGKSPDRAAGMLRYIDPSKESRIAALAPLREWIKTLPANSKISDRCYSKCIITLTLGQGGKSAPFDSTTQWINQAHLTLEESRFLTRRDLLDITYYIRPNEAGQWAEWFGAQFPAEIAQRTIQHLASNRRTAEHIKDWLESAPNGPGKSMVLDSIESTKP